jgi:Ran GTPase-activating protein (RanGAP) involved in mRNA processing and transport
LNKQGLTGIDNIHTLILRENRLKDDGLRLVVSALMQKKSLKCVDLSYNIAKIGGSHYKYALADRLFPSLRLSTLLTRWFSSPIQGLPGHVG